MNSEYNIRQTNKMVNQLNSLIDDCYGILAGIPLLSRYKLLLQLQEVRRLWLLNRLNLHHAKLQYMQQYKPKRMR